MTPRNMYTWLTQPVLVPTNAGRVTMDALMKLVTTALEWSFEAKAPNVRAETLEKAAELLLLRRDTLRIIDGGGPVSDTTQSHSTGQDQANETEEEGVSERANPEDITALVTPANVAPAKTRNGDMSPLFAHRRGKGCGPDQQPTQRTCSRVMYSAPRSLCRRKITQPLTTSAEQGSTSQAEPDVSPAPAPPKRGRRKKSAESGTQDSETTARQVDAENPIPPRNPKRTRRVGEPAPKRYAVGEPEDVHHG